MRDLIAQLAGRPHRLLPFDAVRDSLRLRHLVDRGLQEVPLDQIVGSLTRAREFTRAFLPRRESLRKRWQSVEELTRSFEGFPPVELYKVSSAYFVVDGHHRISVLRSLGAETVEARVKEFITPVPLGPEDSLDEVIRKRGLADFLEATGLVPDDEDAFRVTVTHGYDRLLEHISVHRYYMGLEAGYPIDWRDAVDSWYASVYRPMIATIRRSGIVHAGRLEGFVGRTETDLYLFTMDHLHQLRERYGAEAVGAAEAVEDFGELHRAPRLGERLQRLWRRPSGEETPSPADEDSGEASPPGTPSSEGEEDGN